MSKNEEKQTQTDLNAEYDAAQDYFERTGLHLHFLNPTDQRKILEAWKEDHEATS